MSWNSTQEPQWRWLVVALCIPWVLDRVPDRPVMLIGSLVMAVGLFLMSTGPDFASVLPIWFVIGMGWSMVQTPSGRVVNRSAAAPDRQNPHRHRQPDQGAADLYR